MSAPALFAALLASMASAACISLAPANESHAARRPREVGVFAGADGAPARWHELVDAAARAEVVLIGENHGHPLGLASAAALFEDVLARSPDASIAFEFFERDEQDEIDAWLASGAPVEDLARALGRTEQSFPPGHRAMVSAAARAKRPIYAANAPRELVRRARIEGFDALRALPGGERELVDVPDALDTGAYRERFDGVMAPAGEAPSSELRARLDSVFRSQQTWDWTMARTLAATVARYEHPVFLVIGRFHVDFAGGTYLALQRCAPGTRTLTVSFSDTASPFLLPEDVGRADFVVYVGEAVP